MPLYDYPNPKYRDRTDAGEVLASQLQEYRGKGLVVLAIPNGGVPVGAVIAEAIEAEFYVLIVRKLQIPDNPEAGFGALTSDGFLLLNYPLIERLGLTATQIEQQKGKALGSIRSRQHYFGRRSEVPSLHKRSVILVDDGLASGFTMDAAIQSAKSQGAEQIIVAVPTSSMTAYRRLKSQVDRIICPDVSRLQIFAVAHAYQHWYDLEEEEVLHILETLSKRRTSPEKT